MGLGLIFVAYSSMISRRLVRIKTLQALYAVQQSGEESTKQGRASLKDSILRTHDVYLFLLEFPHYLNEYLLSEQEIEAKKFYPDKGRIRRLGLFDNNALATAIYNKTLNYKRRLFTNSWTDLAEQFETVIGPLFEQDFTTDYLVFDKPSHAQQQSFLQDFYHWLLMACEPFHGMMEEEYGAWNDDEDGIARELEKTITGSGEDFVALAFAAGLQDDEVKMGLQLFDLVTDNNEDYELKIQGVTDNWDPGRIAIIDLLCIKLALAEFLSFPQVPVKVSINEYLEVVKDYSTPNSGRFLNGVLDKLRIKLEKDGSIQKTGRGLRDK